MSKPTTCEIGIRVFVCVHTQESHMKRFAIALLTSTAMVAPVMADALMD